MELVLPKNYVEIEQEEMMYLDGGWSVPKAVVSFAVNGLVNTIAAFFMGGGGGISTLKLAIKSVGRKKVTDKFRTGLSKFISIQLANRISGIIIGLITGYGGFSIGGLVANYLDNSRFDGDRRLGWIGN